MAKFIRKQALLNGDDKGVATVHIDGVVDPLVFSGRGIYETDDELEIATLSEDPEFVEVEVNKKGNLRPVK